jgi:drug/metabolite transporter (DMT)-like permease
MTLTWFLCAIAPPFFYCISNLIDQYIVRHHVAGSPASFLALSGLTCLPVLLCLIPWMATHGPVDMHQGLWVMGTASLFSGAVIPYFYAIEQDDSHQFIAVYQTVPVFVCLLSYLLLGETLSVPQLIGGGIVIAASMASMINIRELVFKTRPFALILLSSVLFAGYTVALRSVAPDLHWLSITFWLCCGWFLMGCCIVTLAPRLRHSLSRRFIDTRGRVFSLSALQEFADVAASAFLVMALAYSAVPAGITGLMGETQPFIAVPLGFLAAKLIPAVYTFDVTRGQLLQKSLCFVVALLGLAMVLGIITI